LFSIELAIEMNTSSERKYVIIGIVILVGIIFILRLFYLQIYEDSFKLSANNNVLRPSIQYPARGLIYDRKGKLLVYNEAVYDLMVTPKQLKKIDTAEFCSLIGISHDDFVQKLFKARQYSIYKASLFEKQLSAETYAALQEKLYNFPGFFVEERTVRKYPDRAAAHVLGYIGEVDTNITRKNPYYKKGDYIGISGIENADGRCS
jgi:penicillin-binding protein 2